MSIDTKTLRKVYGLMVYGVMSNSIISCCDEIDELRAELATTKAERDSNYQWAVEMNAEMTAELATLKALIARSVIEIAACPAYPDADLLKDLRAALEAK